MVNLRWIRFGSKCLLSFGREREVKLIEERVEIDRTVVVLLVVRGRGSYPNPITREELLVRYLVWIPLCLGVATRWVFVLLKRFSGDVVDNFIRIPNSARNGT